MCRYIAQEEPEVIGVPITARGTDEAVAKMQKASSEADLLEIRLDGMEQIDMERLLAAAPLPVIATYRSRRQGGLGTLDNRARSEVLITAAEAGASYIDVEYSLPLEIREELFDRCRPGRIILSHHHPNGTPEPAELSRRLRKMADSGADVVKIVTRANRPEDNLTVLGLIPRARDLGVDIIAFCMGPIGRLSRIACVPMGGFLTFAAFEKGEESADGQMTVAEMKAFQETLALCE